MSANRKHSEIRSTPKRHFTVTFFLCSFRAMAKSEPRPAAPSYSCDGSTVSFSTATHRGCAHAAIQPTHPCHARQADDVMSDFHHRSCQCLQQQPQTFGLLSDFVAFARGARTFTFTIVRVVCQDGCNVGRHGKQLSNS